MGTGSPSALEDAVPHLPVLGPPRAPPCLALRASAGANPSETHSEPGFTYPLGEGARFLPSQPGEKEK